MRASLLVLLFSGCVVSPIDLEGRRCPCVTGWICDEARDLCVRGAIDAAVLDAPDGRDAARDGAIDAAIDAAVDAGRDAGPPLPEFGAPEVVAALDDPAADDRDPSLTADELEIFFTSNRGGGDDVWTSQRSAIGGAWSDPAVVSALASTSAEADPEVSADGLRLYFTSLRTGSADVWESTRADRTSAWSAPVRLLALSSADEDCCAVLRGDGLELVLASSRLGAGMDLFRASRTSASSAWGPLEPLAELNTTAAESNPYWTASALEIFFDSDRPGGSGGRDVYYASRTAVADPFGAPRSLPSLSSAFDDRDVWLSPDGQRAWLATDSSGDLAIVTAARR